MMITSHDGCLVPEHFSRIPHMLAPEKIAVAVVEDDESLRVGLVGIVKGEAGFHLAGEYRTAEEAIRSLPKNVPDLVLMDINLPGKSGIDCVRELAPRFPHLAFLMLTVFGDSQRIFEALRVGAVGYLLKRSTSAELVAAIRHVAAGGSAMSPEVARLVTKFFLEAPPPNLAGEIEALSSREEEILRLLSEASQYKEIAAELQISIDTVRWHVRHIYEKLHVHSRTEAVVKYLNRRTSLIRP